MIIPVFFYYSSTKKIADCPFLSIVVSTDFKQFAVCCCLRHFASFDFINKHFIRFFVSRFIVIHIRKHRPRPFRAHNKPTKCRERNNLIKENKEFRKYFRHSFILLLRVCACERANECLHHFHRFSFVLPLFFFLLRFSEMGSRNQRQTQMQFEWLRSHLTKCDNTISRRKKMFDGKVKEKKMNEIKIKLCKKFSSCAVTLPAFCRFVTSQFSLHFVVSTSANSKVK